MDASMVDTEISSSLVIEGITEMCDTMNIIQNPFEPQIPDGIRKTNLDQPHSNHVWYESTARGSQPMKVANEAAIGLGNKYCVAYQVN